MRIDRIAGSMFSQCQVLYGNTYKPEAIYGIHISDSTLAQRICLLQGRMSIEALEQLGDEQIAGAIGENAKLWGYTQR